MSVLPLVYRSTDPGAPQLTGQVGALINVLRATLVTGYGTTPNVKPGAGWTEAFTGTNKAVFRNNPIAGTGGRLRVDDGATVAGSNARYALVRGYESLTDVDTGIGPAPTAAQLADGLIVPKSATLDSTSRGWVMVACERFLYLFVNLNTTAVAGWVDIPYFPFFAGDLVSRKPGDAFHFMVAGLSLNSYVGTLSQDTAMIFQAVNSWGAGVSTGTGGFLLRGHQQVSGAVYTRCAIGSDGLGGRVIGSTEPYPDPVSGGLIYERLMVLESQTSGVIRGYMPNAYIAMGRLPFVDSAIQTDIQGLPAGTQILPKSFAVAQNNIATSLYSSQLLIDLSNAW